MRVGLGCSRFGSLMRGADRQQAIALVHRALDLGIVDFDTADIYGQGDSERFLGEALTTSQARICTKAGQVFPFRMRALIPLKAILKPMLAHGGASATAVRAARAAPLPRNWSADHLTRALDASLTRLKREQVDIFLLHSPSAEVIRAGEAMATLAGLRQAGKAANIGVSLDDADSFAAAIADPRVTVIQFPSNPGAPMDTALLGAARARGIQLIAREILGGATNPAAVAAALAFAADQPVDVALIGTRSAGRLAHTMAALPAC